MQLGKELDVQYPTAWHMLHRIRKACDRGEFKLANVVEADGTYVGGKEKNKHTSRKLNSTRDPVGKGTVAGVPEHGRKVKAQTAKRTDAATFGFNEGNCEVDTNDRMAAFARSVDGKCLSYTDLIADNGGSATPVAA